MTHDAFEVEDEADGMDQLVEDESGTNDVTRLTYREAAMQSGEKSHFIQFTTLREGVLYSMRGRANVAPLARFNANTTSFT